MLSNILVCIVSYLEVWIMNKVKNKSFYVEDDISHQDWVETNVPYNAE